MPFRKLSFKQLIKELDKVKYKQLHIHHTWKPDHSNFHGTDHNRIQQGMKNYHVNTNGWSDIGQHLSLFPDGVWLTGRPFNQTPASIKGWNTGALCVEMVGNFDTGHDKLEGNQLEQILMLIKYFINRYGEQSIKFHRENSSKSCPGTSLNKLNMIKEAKQMGENNNNPDNWAKKTWEWAIKEGYVDGTRPKDTVTRQELMAVIQRVVDKIG